MQRIKQRPPIVRITNGTFYRHHPGSEPSRRNPSLFDRLEFEIASAPLFPQNWCVIGPSLSGKTAFLQVLRGNLFCQPPSARSFPYLSRVRSPPVPPQKAVQYVGFDSERNAGALGGAGPGSAAYLSARYESRRESTDFSLRDFLLGNTELNPLEAPYPKEDDAAAGALLDSVVRDLNLGHLLDLPAAFLSNGQGRRARIARALLAEPEVLLLDEPFMGLDPANAASLSALLGSLAAKESLRLVLSARPQDPIPEWVSHLIYLKNDCLVQFMGPKKLVLGHMKYYIRGVTLCGVPEDEDLLVHPLMQVVRTLQPTAPSTTIDSTTRATAVQHPPRLSTRAAEPLVEFEGCQVCYGDKVALGNWSRTTPQGKQDGLVWTVRRGERWGIFGPNGSGKTTLVSLLSSDHPQSYSLPIKLFGRSRLPEPGSGLPPLTFWDIQSRIGHSSPEVHQHMPRSLSIRQVVENAWAPTFGARPTLDEGAKKRVEAALYWFTPELRPGSASSSSFSGAGDRGLGWADDCLLGEASLSAQRVALFLRAIVKAPDVVVLDEAFSGMDEAVRDKCMLFLAHGQTKMLRAGQVVDSMASKRAVLHGLTRRQALICIAQVKDEVPDCVTDWLCLPEADTGRPAWFGWLRKPFREDEAAWRDMWALGRA